MEKDMKRVFGIKLIFVSCLLLSLLASACANTQISPYGMKTGKDANWERYRPSDLQLVIDEHSKYFDDSPKVQLSINALASANPYRVKVSYMDDHRKISDGKKQLISAWGKSTQIEEIFIRMFEQEIIFKYGSKIFWFPIQSALIPDFKMELKKGDEVNLYVMFIGTFWEGNQIQWVFIVNDFEKINP
jgi:hypothetical protein